MRIGIRGNRSELEESGRRIEDDAPLWLVDAQDDRLDEGHEDRLALRRLHGEKRSGHGPLEACDFPEASPVSVLAAPALDLVAVVRAFRGRNRFCFRNLELAARERSRCIRAFDSFEAQEPPGPVAPPRR